jgi:crotonobetainyl-CoA:carnitine CoA-transferase CaiB-like acyl-CoA transferase
LRHTSTEWTDILNAAGVPTGPIYTIDQMFADPQVQHLAMTPEVTHDRLGTYPVVGQAVNLSAHPRPERMALPAPDAGQHTDEVLRSLGYDEASIIALREQGVV